MYCVYLEVRLLKSAMTANKYVKTKGWQEVYKTRKKVIVRHLNPTVEDEKAFFGPCEPRLAVKNI